MGSTARPGIGPDGDFFMAWPGGGGSRAGAGVVNWLPVLGGELRCWGCNKRLDSAKIGVHAVEMGSDRKGLPSPETKCRLFSPPPAPCFQLNRVQVQGSLAVVLGHPPLVLL